MGYEIPLLQPQVLSGVVEKLVAPESLTLINRFRKEAHPFSNVAVWDIIKGSRTVASPNVPNSEAHIVPHLGRAQQNAAFIYLRDKKVFQPTTMRWLRPPGGMTPQTAAQAEQAVLREVTDLNNRFDNFVEMTLWGALMGELHFRYRDVVADVDYQMPASHKVTPAVGWSTASPQQIIADINAWRKVIRRDGRVKATEAYVTSSVMDLVFNAFTSTGTLLSDRMKESYYSSGTIPGFMNMDWNLVDATYDDGSGSLKEFVPEFSFFMGNYTEGDPIRVFEGPTADLDAPMNHTGRFMKSEQPFDPSARIILLEYSFMPVVTRPENMVYAADVE